MLRYVTQQAPQPKIGWYRRFFKPCQAPIFVESVVKEMIRSIVQYDCISEAKRSNMNPRMGLTGKIQECLVSSKTRGYASRSLSTFLLLLNSIW